MKVTVKFLKGTGTWAIFKGSKNCGSNFIKATEAVSAAKKKFPGSVVVLNNGFAPAEQANINALLEKACHARNKS